MLLLDHRTATRVAIQRASSVSNALDANLHVVLAIPRGTAPRHPSLVASHVLDVLRSSAPRHGFELEVVRGSLAELGSEIARDEAAALVVVDSHLGSKRACRLAHELGVPVLVARDARPDGDWIAASDMQHRKFPVLSVARDFARALERDIIYFHNAKPGPVYVADPMAGAASYVEMLKSQDESAAAKRERLESMARRQANARSRVVRAANTADALLQLARDRDADMVAVGHRRRSWLGRVLGRGTPERVVDHCRRSVLIVPLRRDGVRARDHGAHVSN
jgi:nucleotide-binding universal stress UspA family protein